MDKFATLEPVRLYASNTGVRLFSRGTASNDGAIPQALVGSLPSSLHTIIVYHLPIPDIPTYSRCSRATRICAAHESVWEKRWKALGIDNDPLLHNILEPLQRKNNEKPAAAQPTSLSYSHTNDSYKNKYIRVHNLLKSLTRILLSPSQLILSQLAEQVNLSLYHEAKLLRLLSHFLSPDVQPLRQWESLYLSLRSAMDRFDSNLLSAFDVADGKGDEEGMKEAAASSWELWDKSSADWEMGKVWAEKKEIFYQQGKWKALDNFT
jgi:recyclin-1